MKLRRRASRHTADVVMSILLAVVAADSTLGSLGVLPSVLLAIKLNVFVAPIAIFTGVFPFEWWVWYVISLMWGSQIVCYVGTDIPGVVASTRRGRTESSEDQEPSISEESRDAIRSTREDSKMEGTAS